MCSLVNAVLITVLAVLLVRAQGLSQQSHRHIIHRHGYCIWYGECATSPYGKYNCFYNGPAKPFAQNKELFDLINSTCPEYINKTDPNSSTSCCDVAQMKTLQTEMAIAISLFSRCPACLKNFLNHFCAITCDPSQSLFMNTNDVIGYSISGGIESYIKDVDIYVTIDYAERLFNSCKNVEFVDSHTKVIDLMCGAGECNATKWLTYLGDPNLNHGESPFLMRYFFEPTPKVPGHPDMRARSQANASFYACNDTRHGVACRCSDCPTNCAVVNFTDVCLPPLLQTDGSSLTFTEKVTTSVGFAISVAVWLMALVYAILHHDVVPKSSGSDQSSSLHKDSIVESVDKANLLTSSTSSESCVTKKSHCHVRSGQQLTCSASIVDDWIKTVFSRYGKLVVQFWHIILPMSILICVGLSCGLFFFRVTSDPTQLWTSPSARARVEQDYFNSNFGPSHRIEKLVITAPNVSGYFFVPLGTFDANWTFGPVMQMEVLKEVFWLQNNLTEMKVPFVDKKGRHRIITLQDICFKPHSPTNNNCSILSLLNYFQNIYDRLINTTYDPFRQIVYNASYHIHFCVRDPSYPGGRLNPDCLAAFGGPIEPDVVLGKIHLNSYTNRCDYDTAEVLYISFVNNNTTKEENRMAKAWERAFIKFVSSYSGKYIKVHYSAERSIRDELTRGSELELLPVLTTYLLAFVYCTLFLGHIKSLATGLVGMRLTLALCGVLLVVLAVSSSLGLLSYLGLPANLLVIRVMPLLVLAVGLDNLFFLVHSYENQAKKFASTHDGSLQSALVRELMAGVLEEAASRLLLTSLPEIAVFFLGGLSTVPAVRSFSFYMAAAVVINLLLQLSVFVSVMALTARRGLTVLLSEITPPVGQKAVQWFWELFAKLVLHWLVRPFVLLFFGLTLTCSLACLGRINIGMDPTIALPKDSYLMPYFSSVKEYPHDRVPVYFVIMEGYNYSSIENQNKIYSLSGCDTDSIWNQIVKASQLPHYTHVAEPSQLWLDAYLEWLSPESGCCGYQSDTGTPNQCFSPGSGSCKNCLQSARPSAAEFEAYLSWFLQKGDTRCGGSGDTAAAVRLNSGSTTIKTSYVKAYHTALRDSRDYIAALRHARELGDSLSATLNHTVFPTSAFYVYYEQYLTIVPDMAFSIGVSFGAVFLVCYLLLGLDVWAAVLAVVGTAMILVHTIGSMAYLQIELNAVSMTNLVMIVGISLGFSSHFVRQFLFCSLPTRHLRAVSVLTDTGGMVVGGIAMTKLLAVFALVFASPLIFDVYYFRMYMSLLLWATLHGLVLLPVLLSYIGPTFHPVIVNSKTSKEKCVSQKAEEEMPHKDHFE